MALRSIVLVHRRALRHVLLGDLPVPQHVRDQVLPARARPVAAGRRRDERLRVPRRDLRDAGVRADGRSRRPPRRCSWRSARLLLFSVFPLLAYTDANLWVTTVLIGIAFSLVPAVMWPAVPYLVAPNRLGTAYGLMTMVQAIGLTVFNLDGRRAQRRQRRERRRTPPATCRCSGRSRSSASSDSSSRGCCTGARPGPTGTRSNRCDRARRPEPPLDRPPRSGLFRPRLSVSPHDRATTTRRTGAAPAESAGNTRRKSPVSAPTRPPAWPWQVLCSAAESALSSCPRQGNERSEHVRTDDPGRHAGDGDRPVQRHHGEPAPGSRLGGGGRHRHPPAARQDRPHHARPRLRQHRRLHERASPSSTARRASCATAATRSRSSPRRARSSRSPTC